MSSKIKNNTLFENSDSEDECNIKTNSSYARHYDEFRKKEILSHLKNIDSESDSSDDASTDEELVNPEFDKEFLKSLAFLKSKDPQKYEKIPKFFEHVPTVEDTIKEKQLYKSKSKPLTVADYQRDRLIKTEGRMSEDEEEAPDMTYTAEQEKIKSDLKKALEDSGDEDDGLFKVRDKPREEVEKEDEDYLKWLAGQKKEVKLGDDAKTLKPLKDFWTSNALPKADKFLRDYIVNKRYMDPSNVSTYDDVVGLSEDEVEVEQQAEYETKYNFRFEEPDNDFIKRFPRKIDDSVRVQDTTRAEKRKERDERKAKEKELKMKDLRELQNIRKREIEQKLMLLREVAGKEELALQEEDLDTEFDPAEHDRRMAAMFNNDYYGIDEGDQKPEFPDIDADLNIENWDNFDATKIPGDDLHCEDEDFVMDCDYNPEESKKKQIQDELIEMSKGRKRRKKLSKLAEIIKKEKPAFDPATSEKTYEEYLDEYYKLDYEDIIGDQPCRFKYTECVPNDFGLTVEEILMASNKELNQWASLKKTMQNRPKNVEMNDVDKYNKRRNNVALKKKIFQSMYGQPESDNEEDENSIIKPSTSTSIKTKPEATVTSKSLEPSTTTTNNEAAKKNKKKKNKKVPTKNTEVSTNGTEAEKPESTEAASSPGKFVKPIESGEKPQKSSKRKFNDNDKKTSPGQNNAKKMKFNKNGNKKFNNQAPSTELSENRLKAFGINPKKFKNKIKYGGGKNNNQQNHKNAKPFQKKKMNS